MDIILLAICVFYLVKGYIKGLVSMLFSLFGVVFIFVLAWKLSDFCLPYFKNWFDFSSGLSNVLDQFLPGQFANIFELEQAVSQSHFGVIFAPIFSKLFLDITFDGNLTAGQILAKPLNSLCIKLLAFVALFVTFVILLKLLRFLFNRIVKFCGLGFCNRIFGSLVGLCKGIVFFGICYFVLLTLSNLFLNETLLTFVKSGQVSNFVYENIVDFLFSIFYNI
ncbi:MAG: CvpA family protein [Clostridia bacterium]|nr:CvpA family protein [Clostridia bacterium]